MLQLPLRLPALPAGQQRHYAWFSWLVVGVVVLALITRGFKAAPPEMTATEKATVRTASGLDLRSTRIRTGRDGPKSLRRAACRRLLRRSVRRWEGLQLGR
jgi:hypothetical protein